MRRLVLSTVFLFLATPAFAQQAETSRPAFARPSETLPLFVFDARGAFAMLKQDPVTAASLGITTADLPTHGLGIVGGAHIYPIRHGGFALGVGAELLLAKGSHQSLDEDGVTPLGPEVRRQLQSLSGQLSLNFGHRQGWSYLTVGMGPVGFDTYLAGTLPDGLRPMTLNYGFGARWFNTPHVAFSIDLRFYATPPALPTLVVGERERNALVVFSAGISLK